MLRPILQAAKIRIEGIHAQNRFQSPRLPPPIRRRRTSRAQRLRWPASPPFLLPQSQHLRLNHRSVRVSRRKKGIRQSRRRHPRHERRPCQSASRVQGQTKTQFPVAQRPHPQNHPKIRRLAEKTIHGPHLHGHRSQLLPNRQSGPNRARLAPSQSQRPPRPGARANLEEITLSDSAWNKVAPWAADSVRPSPVIGANASRIAVKPGLPPWHKPHTTPPPPPSVSLSLGIPAASARPPAPRRRPRRSTGR